MTSPVRNPGGRSLRLDCLKTMVLNHSVGILEVSNEVNYNAVGLAEGAPQPPAKLL